MSRSRLSTVYLAGPTSVQDTWREEAAWALANVGIATYNPAKPYRGVDPKKHGDWVQSIDRAALQECDAVLACLNPLRLGTCREIEYAWHLGIPVYAFGLEHVGCFASDLMLFETLGEALNALLEGLQCRDVDMFTQDTGGCLSSVCEN